MIILEYQYYKIVFQQDKEKSYNHTNIPLYLYIDQPSQKIQPQLIMMKSQTPIISLLLALFLFLSLASITNSAYIPELQACASTPFLNRQIIKFGPTIQKQLDTANITIPPFDDKFQGVHVQFNLTNITQKFAIDWSKNASIITVKDSHTFQLLMKNVNITMKGHLEFKIGLGIKQKGTLDIDIEKLQADVTISFTQPKCGAGTQNKTLGFGIQIVKVYINPDKLNIKIQGKTIDNLIIRAVTSVLKSRLPGLIEKAAIQKGNPAIQKFTCSPLNEYAQLGNQSYVVIVNTTEVPHFVKEDLLAPIDVTFVNAISNATNNQIENDNLPQTNLFPGKAELSLVVSSNMMNSIMWLVDDSNFLSLEVTNEQLGPNPPIQLNTLNLSILIPSLSKWPRKQVILLIEPSNKFSHLYIRDGKIVAALSLSIRFVVNLTGQGLPAKQCINKNQCVVACNLNTTLSFSAAVHIEDLNTLRGLVHTISIQQIKVKSTITQTIESQIQVKTEQLKKILNTMVGSFRPQINQKIQTGIPIDISQLQRFQVQEVLMMTKKDYAAVGISFKL